MKLELKHLAAYLPYGLQIQVMGEWHNEEENIPKIFEMVGLGSFVEYHEIGRYVNQEIYYEDVFPILHPLSDLTKEIQHNGEKFVPHTKIQEVDGEYFIHFENGVMFFDDICSLNVYEVTRCYSLTQKLFEWHFDVFGLIDAGLAIDINKL